MVLVAAVAVLGLASCKKDYTCECDNGEITITEKYQDTKKKDAKESCEALDETYGSSTTCELVK